MNPTDHYSAVSAGYAQHNFLETMKLHETIKAQIASTEGQSKLISRLTIFMAVLAVVQTLATVAQLEPLLTNYFGKNQRQSTIGAPSQATEPGADVKATSAPK